MRAIAILLCVPMLAACEREPTPKPDPPRADPVVQKVEQARTEHLAGAPSRGDFKVNFGEPFIGFENRGTRMAIRQNYAGASYRVVDVAMNENAGVWTFRGKEGAIPDDTSPFVLTVERGQCKDAFSGEVTRHKAWLGTAANPRQTWTCAALAR